MSPAMLAALRSKLISGVSVAGAAMVLSAPALAADREPMPRGGWSPEISTLFEAYGGFSWLNGDAIGAAEDDDFFITGGSARILIPLPYPVSFQAELMSENGFVGDASDSYGGGFHAGGHLTYLHDETFLFGVLFGSGLSEPEDDTSSTGTASPLYFVGLEGEWRVADFSLLGQVGYVDTDQPPEYDILNDAIFGRAVAKYFFGDNTMFQGEIAYFDGENDNDNAATDDVEVIQWSARLEQQLPWTPPYVGGIMTGFLEYRGMSVDDENIGIAAGGGRGNAGDFTDHTIVFGFSVALDEPNLRSIHRNGPGLTMPNFSRATTEVVYTD